MTKSVVVPMRRDRPAPSAGPLTDSAVEMVVSAIRSLIDERRLSVGDPLPSERELCEMFSSSRTTVREAMRMLKTYGVVAVRPKVGAVIIDRRIDAVFDLYSFGTLELSRQTFLDTQGFRQLIEVGAVDGLIARVDETDLDELGLINDAVAAAATPERSALEDFRFHTRLVAVLGNRQIDELYRIMKPVMLKIMENRAQRGASSENHAEHRRIIEALSGRQRLAYQFHMTQHLEAGLMLLDT